MKAKDLTTEQLAEASGMFRAIAHPVRIALLSHLGEGRMLSVTEIHQMLGISQATASHHLGILKDKGVLSSRRDGKNTFYFLKHEQFVSIINHISQCTANEGEPYQ